MSEKLEKPKRGRPAKPKEIKEPKPRGGARAGAGRKDSRSVTESVTIKLNKQELAQLRMVAQQEGLTNRQILMEGCLSLMLEDLSK
jgi:hypothetical protein